MMPKKFIPYDGPAHLFRRYQAWKCEEDGGLKPDTPIPMLRYGAIRRVTRALVFKFGQFSLLLRRSQYSIPE